MKHNSDLQQMYVDECSYDKPSYNLNTVASGGSAAAAAM